jgi:hypothetical protein
LVIPRIIHQTWRDEPLPDRFRDMAQTWREKHPDWEYRLWTDDDLERLVTDFYPHFLEQFLSYPNPVQRADAGRYLVLHRHGGVYSDIDTTCLFPFDLLTGENRIVFAQEPNEHSVRHTLYRGGTRWMLFNGTIVSPKSHPFWESVLAMMVRCRHAKDVLESTGPLMLTGCMLAYPDAAQFTIHSCHLFNPVTSLWGASCDPEFGPYSPHRLSVHHWAVTWFSIRSRKPVQKIKTLIRKVRYKANRGTRLSPKAEQARIAINTLLEPVPDDANPANQNIAILVPVRDAENHVPRCLELIDSLDVPKNRLKLVFCEGDSCDGTVAAVEQGLADLEGRYRGTLILRCNVGTRVERKKRWDTLVQRQRRAGIAKVRNHLIQHGLNDSDDWALWIDVDVCDYPADIVHRLVECRAKIVTPNCMLDPGGRSFDLNNFLDVGTRRDQIYYKYTKHGLYQPPASIHTRRHLHDMRYLDRVPLTGVGGTMLLVHGSVHRAGLTFPEVPYKDLIETEGFGQLACDCGVRPIGLPNVEILHARN